MQDTSDNLNKLELIDEVLKINEDAKKIITKEKEKEKDNLQKIKLKKEMIVDSIEEKSAKAIKKFEDFNKRKLMKQVEMLENNKHQVISKLEEIYKQNKNEWIENIVSKTLNQENNSDGR